MSGDNWTVQWEGPDSGGLVAWGDDVAAAGREFDERLEEGVTGLKLVVRRSWRAGAGKVIATGPDGEKSFGPVSDGLSALSDTGYRRADGKCPTCGASEDVPHAEGCPFAAVASGKDRP